MNLLDAKPGTTVQETHALSKHRVGTVLGYTVNPDQHTIPIVHFRGEPAPEGCHHGHLTVWPNTLGLHSRSP